MVSQNPTNAPHRVTAVIPAAGSGIRMGLEEAKQYLELGGKPLLAHTLRTFQASHLVDEIIIVVPEKDVDYCLQQIVQRYQLSKVHRVISGGERRQDSVRNGIEAVADNCRWVLVHDGVRPFVSIELIEKVVKAARRFRAVITGLPVNETIKQAGSKGNVLRTIERRDLWLMQTPQIFRREDIHLAHQEALRRGWTEATDDAFLVEKMGISVKIIEGEERNIKITTPHDLQVARFLLSTESR
jgi:2-C-methyl-D-erythritol 4-phosphate cytidylyltransferase